MGSSILFAPEKRILLHVFRIVPKINTAEKT
jgi:hypothetical protein